MSLPVDAQITFLYTRDLAKSAPFYEDVLGLTLALDQGSCRIYHITGRSAYVGMCERDHAPEKPEGVIFTFVTDDVDGWYERITSKGVKCEYAPRVSEEYKLYHFFVRDPNGYKLEFQRFNDESWDKSKSD